MPKVVRGKDMLVVSEAIPGPTRQMSVSWPISYQVSEISLALALN